MKPDIYHNNPYRRRIAGSRKQPKQKELTRSPENLLNGKNAKIGLQGFIAGPLAPLTSNPPPK